MRCCCSINIYPYHARDHPLLLGPPPVTSFGSPSINAPSVQSRHSLSKVAVEHLLVTEVPVPGSSISRSGTPASLPLGKNKYPTRHEFSPFFLLQESCLQQIRYAIQVLRGLLKDRHTTTGPGAVISEDSFSSTVVCPTSRKGH